MTKIKDIRYMTLAFDNPDQNRRLQEKLFTVWGCKWKTIPKQEVKHLDANYLVVDGEYNLTYGIGSIWLGRSSCIHASEILKEHLPFEYRQKILIRRFTEKYGKYKK